MCNCANPRVVYVFRGTQMTYIVNKNAGNLLLNGITQSPPMLKNLCCSFILMSTMLGLSLIQGTYVRDNIAFCRIPCLFYRLELEQQAIALRQDQNPNLRKWSPTFLPLSTMLHCCNSYCTILTTHLGEIMFLQLSRICHNVNYYCQHMVKRFVSTFVCVI